MGMAARMDNGTVRVLLIEDDPDDYYLTRELLGDDPENKIVLEWVSDFDAGLDAITRGEHDAFLVDYRLGKGDGLKLLREGLRLGCKAPMILLTGQGDRDLALLALDAGASDFLVKGKIDAAVLERSIRYALQQKRHADELERKVADRTAELERANAALNASFKEVAQLRTALDEHAIVAITDARGRITFVNDKFCAISKYAREELLGQDHRIINSGFHAKEFIRDLWTTISQGRVWQGEIKNRAKDGSFYWVDTTIVPFLNEEGKPRQYVVIRADITEHKEAEAALKEADRRKNEFLATLAHELRNPLAPVRNAVEILRMKGPDIQELHWARDIIDRQTQAMARLIDDLMDISRINQGKIELKREQVELAKIVQGAVETSRPLIESMGHELTVTLPPGTVIVDADLTRLAQVFLNLLNNAAKYTERGGRIELVARVEWRVTSGEPENPSSLATRHTTHDTPVVVVSVTDTGIGIPADKLPTIFEMFSQVEGALSRSQGGLGIGLCLVKRLVEMHGGSVEARSGGLGQGSEFVVRLPTVVEQTYPRQVSDDGDKAQPTSDLRILVVDDNRDAAESLAMLLKMMGNNIHTAHDGEEAVTAAREFQPHVVLCDIGLPKLNGYEACRQMKPQAWDKKMILIAVTGWGQDNDRRKSQEAGFDHHMVKPVDPQALMKLLAELDSVKA